ncbi:MAG: hypothetical protein WCP32_17260, partial [Bacteroidota bacterium]
YYGIMEMSGNVCERPITVGNATGRNYTGNHGDGMLNSSGFADAASWPDATGVGAGFRGGGWSQSIIRFLTETSLSSIPVLPLRIMAVAGFAPNRHLLAAFQPSPLIIWHPAGLPRLIKR